MAEVISEFRTYIGISDSTIVDGVTPTITVAVPEFEPLDAGDIGEVKLTEAKTIDPIGSTTGATLIKKVRTIRCTYFGSDGNQIIPCVHKGERVLVINYAGTEQYYWKAWGKDSGLRANERVRWIAMNRPNSVDGVDKYPDVSDENCYFVEMNTNKGDKWFRIHTGVSDGEAHSYDVTIFPEKGMFEITDNMSSGSNISDDSNTDKGNCIRLISDHPLWRIRNISGSYIELNGPDINIYAPNNINITAGNDINTKCGNNYTSDVGVDRTETVGNNNSKTVGSNEVTTIGSNKTDNIGSAHSVTCPDNSLSGDILSVSMGSAMSVTAGGSVGVNAGAMALSAGSIAYKGAHVFAGPSFVVGTGSGSVPVIIIYGSSSWG